MKKYLILAFKNYGTFFCKEETQETGEIFLIGKFNNRGSEHSFIKHPNDILIN
jgi:hypothetical protein